MRATTHSAGNSRLRDDVRAGLVLRPIALGRDLSDGRAAASVASSSRRLGRSRMARGSRGQAASRGQADHAELRGRAMSCFSTTARAFSASASSRDLPRAVQVAQEVVQGGDEFGREATFSGTAQAATL